MDEIGKDLKELQRAFDNHKHCLTCGTVISMSAQGSYCPPCERKRLELEEQRHIPTIEEIVTDEGEVE